MHKFNLLTQMPKRADEMRSFVEKQKHCLPKELVAGNWWIAFLAQLSHALLRHYLTANLMGVTEISQDLICIFHY